MNTIARCLLPLTLLLHTATAAQEDDLVLRVPQRLHLSFDSLHYFMDPDTGRTDVLATPHQLQMSHFPNGRTIVLDLQKPAVEGLEFMNISGWDEDYAYLSGGELGIGEVILKFYTASGRIRVFHLLDFGEPVMRLRYSHLEEDRWYGFEANVTLRVEELVQH
jgi:hypothetical protein